jgi:quinol monooxygenase YgiN
MIILSLRMMVSPAKRNEVLDTLRLLAGPTSAEAGCIRFGFYEDLRDKNTFLLVEEWESQEYLDRHIRSEDFRKILAVMDTAIERPEIKFVTVSNAAGMELIEELRG